MKILILLTFYFLLFTSYCFPQHNETDTLNVAEDGTISDSTDLGNFELLALEFPATMTSDTVFIQGKNLASGTFKDIYYTDVDGSKKRAHILVQASSIVFIHPIMTYGLPRYVRFVTDDAEAAARTLIPHKGF